MISGQGYLAFLRHQAEHNRRSEDLMAALLAQGLFGDDWKLNAVDQAVITRAAEHVLVSLRHSGWELMFGEHGEFKGVVT